MNKKRIIIITIVLILVVILGLWVSGIFEEKYREKYEKQENEIINVVTEVNLGERAWIDSPSKINIKNTNDYFEITEKVEWEIPEYEEGTTTSFSITVPYTFVVNGISYTGTYEFDNADWSKKTEGLDYKLRVMNVTKDGKIEIEVRKIIINKELLPNLYATRRRLWVKMEISSF